jgi:2-dehydro-3-deoxygluconokinase
MARLRDTTLCSLKSGNKNGVWRGSFIRVFKAMKITDEPRPSIAFIGECMVEIREDVNDHIEQAFAGDTLNTAVYLARLLPASEYLIHYITALGVDPLSCSMIQYFLEEGIECGKIRRFSDKKPGSYRIELDTNGERSFQYWRDQSAARYLLSGDAYDKELESLTDIDYLYLSGISLAILPLHDRQKLMDGLITAKGQGSTICFDSNYRHKLWRSDDEAREWYEKILQITDIAFLTFDDECELWGDSSPDEVLARSRLYGIPEVVLKRGAKPCLIETNETTYSVEAISIPPEKILDTTAAGDSFSAGYLANRIRGETLPPKCATLGHLLSSKVIQHHGAIVSRKLVEGIIKSG